MPLSDPSPVPHPTADGVDPALARHVERLRAVATLVDDAVAHLTTTLDDLPSFDRADVWRGARATAFRDGLADQRRRLVDPQGGIVVELQQTARRLCARADQLEADAVAAAGTGFGPLGAALVPRGPAAGATAPDGLAPTSATLPGWLLGPLLAPE